MAGADHDWQARTRDLPRAGYQARSGRAFRLPDAVADELRRASSDNGEAGKRGRATGGQPRRRTETSLEDLLAGAARAYERDRYDEALSSLRRVLERAPDAPAAKELYGLTLYRLGRWRKAAKELRELYDLTGSYDQHPVIADCERALGHLEEVRSLFDQLRRAGVDKAVLVEGRLVMAGALADSGRLVEAITLLSKGSGSRRHPDDAELRQWYALGDLYERAGDLPRARELFSRIERASPGAFDARTRLAGVR